MKNGIFFEEKTESFMCPHCETQAQFNRIYPDLEGLTEPQARLEFEKASYRTGHSDDYVLFQIWKCQVCKCLLFISTEFSEFWEK